LLVIQSTGNDSSKAFAADRVVIIPMLGEKNSLLSESDAEQGLTQVRPETLTIRTLSLNAPTKGMVLASASASVVGSSSIQDVSARCSITNGSTEMDDTALISALSKYPDATPISLNREFNISASGTITINLVCQSTTRTTSLANSRLTALFIPSP